MTIENSSLPYKWSTKTTLVLAMLWQWLRTEKRIPAARSGQRVQRTFGKIVAELIAGVEAMPLWPVNILGEVFTSSIWHEDECGGCRRT